MLQPDGSWRVHYTSNPCEAFPYPQLAAAVMNSSRSGKQHLATAVRSAMKQLVSGFQAALKGGSAISGSKGPSRKKGPDVRFGLWGGDALQLCSGSGRLPREQRFDAIDLSNLPDHVGFANCLLLAGPRLVPAAASRLQVDLMVWSTSGAATLEVCSVFFGSCGGAGGGLFLVFDRFDQLPPHPNTTQHNPAQP